MLAIGLIFGIRICNALFDRLRELFNLSASNIHTSSQAYDSCSCGDCHWGNQDRYSAGGAFV